MTDLDKFKKMISGYDRLRVDIVNEGRDYVQLMEVLPSDSTAGVFNKSWLKMRKSKFTFEKFVATIEKMHPEYDKPKSWHYCEDLVEIMKKLKRDIKIKNILEND